MAYYINLLTPETYEAMSKTALKVAGFRERQRPIAEEINPGDVLVCYVLKTSKLVGIMRVNSQVYKDDKPLFAEGIDPYTARLDVETTVWLDLKEAVADDDDMVWNHLSFTKSIPKSSLIWTGMFRGSLRKLEVADGKHLEWVLQERKAGVPTNLMKLGQSHFNSKELSTTSSHESESLISSANANGTDVLDSENSDYGQSTNQETQHLISVESDLESKYQQTADMNYSDTKTPASSNENRPYWEGRSDYKEEGLGFIPMSRHSSGKKENQMQSETNSTMHITVPANDAGKSHIEEDTKNIARIQALLARIGERMNFKIWIPMEYRSQVLQYWNPTGNSLLNNLPLNLDYLTLRTVENIDLLWVRDRNIARAFEIEDPGFFYKGVMRLADLVTLQSGMVLNGYIVGPEKLQNAVLGQITRPIFSLMSNSSLANSVSFLSNESVEELSKQKHLEYMNDLVLDEYSIHAPTVAH